MTDGGCPAAQSPDTPDDDLEDEIDWLIIEHGSERAALRALLHDIRVLASDAEQSVSRGYVRGRAPWSSEKIKP